MTTNAAGVAPLERQVRPVAERLRASVVWLERDGFATSAALASEAADEIDLLRGLLQEALEVADNWPGVAYTADLMARCKVAMPGWAPLYE